MTSSILPKLLTRKQATSYESTFRFPSAKRFYMIRGTNGTTPDYLLRLHDAFVLGYCARPLQGQSNVFILIDGLTGQPFASKLCNI